MKRIILLSMCFINFICANITQAQNIETQKPPPLVCDQISANQETSLTEARTSANRIPGAVSASSYIIRTRFPALKAELDSIPIACNFGPFEHRRIDAGYNLVYRNDKGFSVENSSGLTNSLAIVTPLVPSASELEIKKYVLVIGDEKIASVVRIYYKMPSLQQVRDDLKLAFDGRLRQMMRAKYNERSNELEISFPN